MRLAVPWQAGVRIGVVAGALALKGHGSLEFKEAIGTLDASPWLSEAALEVIERVAAYTFSPAGLVLANLLAVGLQDELRHELRAVTGAQGVVLGEDWTPARALAPSALELYRRQGLVEERVRVEPPRLRLLLPQKPADEGLSGSRQRGQRSALELLWSLGSAASAAELSRAAFVSEAAVRALVKKGYAAYELVEAPPPTLLEVAPQAPPRDVLQAPDAAGPQLVVGASRRARLAALLGQIAAELEGGGSVLVLVPEAALVGETAALLASAVPVRVFSAELSDARRGQLWALLRAAPAVLVGTYPALLAPLVELRRVIVLEEANPSYKLTAGCRVFVPTAARFLAEASGAALVLADVTPSPESLKLVAETGAEGALWPLPQAAPRVHVVDLAGASGWPLSADLVRVLKQVAERGRQAVLLSPRRGFSASLRCPSCGWLAMCPNCSLPLRYHREARGLRCHQCGHAQAAPPICPSCQDPMISPRGPGTQWILREVAGVLPGLSVYRYDRDRRDDLAPLLAGEPGVVVATTALFRHPPLPRVSLIALTLLDGSLNGGDFRSDEQALRLLLNLHELSWQARPLVLLQTFQPGAAILQGLRDEEGGLRYSRELLERRERYDYTPYRLLAHLQIAAKQRPVAERAAAWLAGALRTGGATDEELLGPAPAPVERLRGYYCYQLVLRSECHARLVRLIQPALVYRGAARLRIDVDPRDMVAFLE